ncbi:hypothetical protein [Methanobacterium spitsbergense]|uniref:Uncharacterized protein n=1 Tax=Methanobacterium spitsbergense TaxID=2874285 RepID=A0A8T5USF8_9EURY|nr:hypothetical protein [Methanobacterium spitsbergense]MBZ2166982.1 hypothetical protein [Methanobacterium spitsbergense]
MNMKFTVKEKDKESILAPSLSITIFNNRDRDNKLLDEFIEDLKEKYKMI